MNQKSKPTNSPQPKPQSPPKNPGEYIENPQPQAPPQPKPQTTTTITKKKPKPKSLDRRPKSRKYEIMKRDEPIWQKGGEREREIARLDVV